MINRDIQIVGLSGNLLSLDSAVKFHLGIAMYEELAVNLNMYKFELGMKLLLQSMTEALENQVKSKVSIKVLSFILELMLLLPQDN